MYFDVNEVKKYLKEFDRILYEMQNKMYGVKGGNSITLDFIKAMIPHHKAAIEMCQNLLNYTNYYPLMEVANNIIAMQEHGINQMKKIMKSTKGFNNYPQEINLYMQDYLNITGDMICKMDNSLRSMDINLDFISEMLPHHEGAILMCQNLLQYNVDPRLADLAMNIMQNQSEGIKELQSIQSNLRKLKSWYRGDTNGIYPQNQNTNRGYYPW